MTDYIDRKALLDSIRTDTAPFNIAMVFRHIHNIPAADVATVRHGKWKLKMIGAFGDLKQYSCSECGFSLPVNPTKIPPYCENCGTKMSLEEKQE